MTTRLLLRALVLLVAPLVCAYSQGPEVNVLSQVTSVNGAYTAEVREVVYGPHFGGEAPAIEVWVSHAGQSECVLQRPEDVTEVTSRWVGPAQLRIQVTGNQAAEHFQPASLGATIELERL